MKGTVKFFNEAKGFGFITGEDGKEVFVHKSALDGIVIHEKDTVTYDVVAGPRGEAAANVKKE